MFSYIFRLFLYSCTPPSSRLVLGLGPETVQKQSRDSPETVQRQSRDSLETVQRQSRDSPEIVQRQSRDSLETVKESLKEGIFKGQSNIRTVKSVTTTEHPTTRIQTLPHFPINSCTEANLEFGNYLSQRCLQNSPGYSWSVNHCSAVQCSTVKQCLAPVGGHQCQGRATCLFTRLEGSKLLQPGK